MHQLPLLLALAFSGQTAPAESTCPMRVEVRDAGGALMPGATVHDVAGGALVAVTADDGTACVTPARRVTIQVPGFLPAEVASGAGLVKVTLAPAFAADVQVVAERRDARLRDARDADRLRLVN